MVKVKILRPCHGYSYFGGEVAEVFEHQAADLVAHGAAILIPDTVQEVEIVQTIIRKEEVVKKTSENVKSHKRK